MKLFSFSYAYRNLLRAALASSLAIVCLPASAQQVLEEQIVTAQKREQSLQDTPVAVTAFSEEALQNLGVTSLLGIGEMTPNVDIGGGGLEGDDGAAVTIRGIGQVRRDLAIEMPVAMYIDDLFYSQMDGALMNALDIQRVEVLRGPQGTLFGKNATAGALRLFTNNPRYGETNGRITATVGEYDRQDISGLINLGLTDNLALRATIADNQREGHMTRLVDGVDIGNIDNQVIRAKLGWLASENLEFIFMTEHVESDTNGQARNILDASSGQCGRPGAFTTIGGNPQSNGGACGLVGPYNAGPPNGPAPFPPSLRGTGPQWNAANAGNIITGDPFTVLGGEIERSTRESVINSLTITYDINDSLTLTSISGWMDREFARQFDYDASLDFNLRLTNIRGEYETFSQELQLNGSTEWLDWVAGLYYFTEETAEHNEDTGQRGFVNPADLALNQFRGSDTETVRAYLQGTWAITDDLNLTAGFGYTEDDKTFLANLDTIANGQMFSSSDKWTSEQVRVSLDYQLTDNIMAYISYSEGFKSGGFNTFLLDDAGFNAACIALAAEEGLTINNPATACADINQGFLPFGPEELKSYEFGMRSDLFGDRVRLNISAFYSDYTDIQQLNLLLTGRPFTQNTGEREISGVEVETTWIINDALRADLTVGHMDTPDTDNIVDNSYSVGLTYLKPLDNGAEIIASANYGWKDETESTQSSFQPAYGLMSFRLGYSMDRWSAALFCTNCTDEYYNLTSLRFARVQQTLLLDFDVPARPQEWGLEFSYNFGD